MIEDLETKQRRETLARVQSFKRKPAIDWSLLVSILILIASMVALYQLGG